MAKRKENEARSAAPDASETTLEISRVFAAPRDLVYQMWSTPEHLGKWSAPKGFTIPEARTDFREGGSWYAHMRSPRGEDHRVQGRYLKISPGKRIVMTHAWLDESGRPGHETRVTVTFEDHGGGTKMTLVQEGFASKASRDGHAAGWNECFDILAAHLEMLGGGREMVVTRLIDAPRELVFAAFTDPDHISEWWGPNGFRTTTYEKDVRPGGQWLFTMHGPDGTDYPNRIRYTEVRAPELLAYDHDEGEGGDPMQRFKTTVTFDQENGKTRLTLRLICQSAQQRSTLAKFGAIEGGNQTLSRLERYLTQGSASSKGQEQPVATEKSSTAEPFVISRIFEASRELLFAAFTDPQHMRNWWGPKGFAVIAQNMDLRPGGRYHYGLRAPDGSTMWGRFSYREIVAPERIVLVGSFSDEHGGLTRHPLNESWPLEMLSTFLFEDVGDGRSKLTVRWVPINETDEERETFEKGRPSMTGGWTGTMDQLEQYLAGLKSS